MAQIIDIGARLQAAFGFVYNQQSSRLKTLGFAKELAGVSVFVQSDGSFEELTITGNGQNIRFAYDPLFAGSNIFGPPPMVSFHKAKNLTITEIDGADAEVVERYGDRSWEIKIQALLIDMQEHQFPRNKIETIRRIFDNPAPFEIQGEIFDALNIRSIYFTDIDISGVAGFEDTMSCTLDARSIKPVEFHLTGL